MCCRLKTLEAQAGAATQSHTAQPGWLFPVCQESPCSLLMLSVFPVMLPWILRFLACFLLFLPVMDERLTWSLLHLPGRKQNVLHLFLNGEKGQRLGDENRCSFLSYLTLSRLGSKLIWTTVPSTWPSAYNQAILIDNISSNMIAHPFFF